MTKIGNPIASFAYFVGPNEKHFPVLSYNPQMNIYVIMLEYNNGTQIQVLSFSVAANGSLYDGILWVIASFPGNNDRPSATYNPTSNTFLFTCENDVYSNNTIVSSNIVVMMLDGTGAPVFPFAETINGVDHDSRPHVAWNSVTSSFVMVAALSEFLGAPFRDIVGFFIDVNGRVNTTGYVLEAFSLNGNRVSAHSPQLIWAPFDLYYFLLFQVDFDAQQLFTDILFSPIDPTSLNFGGFVSLGSTLPRNRNAFATFGSKTNDFFVVLDADTPGSGTSTIYGVVVAAVTGAIRQIITSVNQMSHVDHHGRSAYSTADGQFLVVWNNGTEREDNVTKRYIAKPQTKSVQDWRKDLKFETNMLSRERKVEVIRLYSGINKRDFDNVFPTSAKRQTATNFLKGVLVCTAIPAPPLLQSSSTGGGLNTRKVVLIATLVSIFGLLAILGVAALIFFFVILPRRRAKSVAMMKFDPDRE